MNYQDSNWIAAKCILGDIVKCDAFWKLENGRYSRWLAIHPGNAA
jgi:hypothetical protein